MSKYTSKGLAALLAAILLIMFTAVPALAFDVRSGDTVTIASGEVIDDDLYVAGKTIIIDGTINGDLCAAAQTITVDGAVNGSFMAAGETVNVNGEVAHAVRAVGETLNIVGNVAGDVLFGGASLNVSSAAEIGGDLLFGTGTARVNGPVEGDISGAVGEATLTSGVGGDVKLKVDTLTIGSTANIKGNLVYTSEEEANIQSGADIGGMTSHKLPEVKERPSETASPFSGVWGKVTGFLMALVAGVIIVLLFPRRLASIAESIRTGPWLSLGWGAVILFATPIAAIIVCVTVIGIPAGLIALALYGMGIYLSQIPVGLFIGRWIIGRFREVESKAILVGALAAGLVILSLLRLIPYVGFFIGLAVVLFGLGAVLVSLRRPPTQIRETASS